MLWGGLMDPDFYRKMWQTIKEDKRPFYSEVTNKRKNGSKYIAELRIFPALDEREQITSYISMERDLTRQKEVDRAKTEFISLASHQLRTPLTSITLGLDILLRGADGELTHAQKTSLREIHTDIMELSDLVGALLNASKIELGTFTVDPKPVHIPHITESILDQFIPLIEAKKLKFIKTYDTPIPRVVTDKNILKTVVQNLFSNAIKYTPQGGVISLKVKKLGENLLIAVKDMGLGIPQGEQTKVFDKYYRAQNINQIDANGSGLGLYLSKLLLEAAKGKIWFTSKENQGTTFYVSLPLN
jgi:signal transduction histidine kinase